MPIAQIDLRDIKRQLRAFAGFDIFRCDYTFAKLSISAILPSASFTQRFSFRAIRGGGRKKRRAK